jgi:hypothetical protein
VRGRMFHPTRLATTTATANGFNSIRRSKVLAAVSNELENGSIIDLGGVLVLFQPPPRSLSTAPTHISSNATPTDLTGRIIQSMNQLRPQCPVLMHTIHFPTSPPHKQKARHMWEQRRGCFDRPVRSRNPSAARVGRASTMALADDGVELDRVPYVFSACGHVHGYCKELEGR